MSAGKANLPARAVDAAGVCGVAAVTAAVVFGVFLPAALRDRAAAAEAEAAARTRQRANGLGVMVRRAEQDIERARTRLANTPLKIRPVSAMNERLDTLLALASECGLTVSDFKPGDPAKGGRFLAAPVRINGSGRYADVVRFLHRLPQRLPDVAVSAFRVAGPAEEQGAGQYTIDARWYATPDPLPNVPTPAVAPAVVAVTP